jgi:hypothetical protein
LQQVVQEECQRQQQQRPAPPRTERNKA